MENWPTKNGFGTAQGSVVIEVIIATVIFSMIIAAALPTLQNYFQSLERLALYSNMLFRDQALLEKTIAYNSAEQETVSGIFASSSITAIEPCLNEAIAMARGAIGTGMSRTLIMTASYSPPLALAAAGNDCGGYMLPQGLAPPFAFSAPHVFESGITSFDFFSGNTYLAASSTDGYNFVVSSTIAQTIISRLITPPVNMLDAAGSYVYLVVVGTTSQLQIVDIQNPSQPKIVATRSLPGVTGSAPSGLSVRYYAGRAYVGTHRTAGNEFHIFDVTTPGNPRWLGSLELNHNINDIVVAGNYAYLATSGNTSDIIVINVADPAHPGKIADLSFTGTEDTERLFLLGTTLYAGRLKGASASHPELVAINVASSSAPSIIATSSLAANITGLRAIAGHVLVATSVGIFSLTTNAIGPGPFFGTPLKVWSQATLGLDSENNMLYTIAATSSAIVSFSHQ